MKKLLFSIFCLALVSAPALASDFEVNVNGGYNIGTSGYGDVTTGTKGGFTVGAQALYKAMDKVMVGVESGYHSLLNISASATVSGVTYSSTTKTTAIPVLAVGRYTLVDNLFVTAGAGIARLTGSNDSTAGTTTASTSTSQTKVAFMGGFGYQAMINKDFSVEPNLAFRVYPTDANTLTELQPSVNVGYHF
jgi:opacity protein-like surface antigen